jgi:hypothetical protein
MCFGLEPTTTYVSTGFPHAQSPIITRDYRICWVVAVDVVAFTVYL